MCVSEINKQVYNVNANLLQEYFENLLILRISVNKSFYCETVYDIACEISNTVAAIYRHMFEKR